MDSGHRAGLVSACRDVCCLPCHAYMRVLTRNQHQEQVLIERDMTSCYPPGPAPSAPAPGLWPPHLPPQRYTHGAHMPCTRSSSCSPPYPAGAHAACGTAQHSCMVSQEGRCFFSCSLSTAHCQAHFQGAWCSPLCIHESDVLRSRDNDGTRQWDALA
jgi:hypothetical protein